MKKAIKSLSFEELADLVRDEELPAFRAQQLFRWLYVHQANSYDDMSNLPASMKVRFAGEYPLDAARVVNRQISSDQTRKYVIEYHDGTRVETVALPSFPEGKALTVCFSTQAGCAMQCAFCATGKEGFVRNLLPGEMIDQVLIAQKDTGIRVSNLVAMGQGEPFLNYGPVLAALRIANSPHALGIGARHITLSTCGIISGIRKLSDEPEQFTLAVSLHAAQQGTRNALMPRMADTPLSELKDALCSYTRKTNRRITLEYIMIRSLNDTDAALGALQSFCEGLLCHINLLPMNPVEGSGFQPSAAETMSRWVGVLKASGTETTVRRPRGADIAGACGQLKNRLR